MPSSEPFPKNLRPALIERIGSMPEDELQLVHSVLLHAEKYKLWSEISATADHEHASSVFDKLPTIIEQVRKEMHVS